MRPTPGPARGAGGPGEQPFLLSWAQGPCVQGVGAAGKSVLPGQLRAKKVLISGSLARPPSGCFQGVASWAGRGRVPFCGTDGASAWRGPRAPNRRPTCFSGESALAVWLLCDGWDLGSMSQGPGEQGVGDSGVWGAWSLWGSKTWPGLTRAGDGEDARMKYDPGAHVPHRGSWRRP